MINKKTKIFFISTIIITLCALFYVHQNIEILKVGYSINTNQKTLSYSLDQHRRLVYNLGKLKSPFALAKRLYAEDIELTETDTDCIYYASTKGINTKSYRFLGNNKTRIIDRILDIFTEKAEARSR